MHESDDIKSQHSGNANQQTNRQTGDAEQRRNLSLDSAGQMFIASLPADIRPQELAQKFPRIINKAAQFTGDSDALKAYFEGLLFDARGNRSGFPLSLMTELVALRDHCLKKFPENPDVWDTTGEVDRGQ